MFKPEEIVAHCKDCGCGLLSVSNYCFRCFRNRLVRCRACKVTRHKGKLVRVRIRDNKEIETCGACGNENWILRE